MLSATLQLCVRILPAKGIPARGVGRNSLISSFPDDRIARKPERNRNFTLWPFSHRLTWQKLFFFSPSFFSFFLWITRRFPLQSISWYLKTLWKFSFASVSWTRLFETTINTLLFYIAISYRSTKFVRSFGLFEKRNFSSISRSMRPDK